MTNCNIYNSLKQEDERNKRLINWLYSIAKKMYNSDSDRERKDLFKNLTELVDIMGDSIYFNNPFID